LSPPARNASSEAGGKSTTKSAGVFPRLKRYAKHCGQEFANGKQSYSRTTTQKKYSRPRS